MKLFENLYEYRELLKSNVKKEIRGKYKGSFLGVLWSFINPLLQTIVYTIVFSIIMKNDMDNYLIFVVTGIIPWNFFFDINDSRDDNDKGQFRNHQESIFPKRNITDISGFKWSC